MNDIKRTKMIIFMRYPDLEEQFVNYLLTHHRPDHIKLRHVQKYFLQFIEDYAYKKRDKELQEFAMLLRFDIKNVYIQKYLRNLLVKMHKRGLLIKEDVRSNKAIYRIIKRGEVHGWA